MDSNKDTKLDPVWLNKQNQLCLLKGVPCIATQGWHMVAVSKDLLNGKMPINGLRHPITEKLSGWYIWSGEEMDQDPEFWVVKHASHFAEEMPYLLQYLGLPPGWRFQIDDKGYEDVWEDKKLLQV